MKRTLSAALLLSALAPFSVRADMKAIRKQMREELEKTSPDSLSLQFNGHFYSLGVHGEDHEEKMALRYAEFVKANEGKKFLFLPGAKGSQTPGIDGTVFDGDPTRPDKRVSFKTLQFATQQNPPIRLAFLILEASMRIREFSDFDKAFRSIFPGDRAFRGWQNRISLMAAMGLKKDVLPDVVVVELQPAWSDEQMQALIAALKEELPNKNRKVPDEVVLFSGSKTYPLKKSLDYSDCNSEFIE